MNEPNPYSSPAFSDPPPMFEQPVRYFKAWLSFFLVATVLGIFIAAFAGGVLGAILGANGFGQQQIYTAGQATGVLISIPVSFLTYRWSVKWFILSDLDRQSFER